MESIDAQLTATVAQLQSAIGAVRAQLGPVLSNPAYASGMTVSERCKMEVLLAYTVNTLFYVYMRTQGAAVIDHPVMAELNRVKGYIEKIKIAEGTLKPSLAVDKEAADRMIKHAIGSTDANRRGDTDGAGKPVKTKAKKSRKRNKDHGASAEASSADGGESSAPPSGMTTPHEQPMEVDHEGVDGVIEEAARRVKQPKGKGSGKGSGSAAASGDEGDGRKKKRKSKKTSSSAMEE